MAPAEVLAGLGIDRVVWLDDMFENDLGKIRQAILASPGSVRKDTPMKVLGGLIDDDDHPKNDAVFEKAVTDILEQASAAELLAINQAVRDHAAEAERETSSVDSNPNDMRPEDAARVSKLLNISETDRYGFESGRAAINLGNFDKANNAVIIDMQNALSEAGSGADAGIGLLKALKARQSNATVFVLTHEALAETEAEKEAQIYDQLDGEGRFPCVISKDRVRMPNESEVVDGLNTALKRAALRREFYDLGDLLADAASASILTTRDTMCRIPPEELEAIFLQRAIDEGASDLHLLKRAFLSQTSKAIETLFVKDVDMAERMTLLRSIVLTPRITVDRHPEIERLRLDEAWTNGDFLNAGRAPLAVGDVFETIEAETARRFILLGQPCDVMLRAKGIRSGNTGELVSFKAISKADHDNTKDRLSPNVLRLQLQEDGGYLEFDFRHSSHTQLNLLDIVSFHQDGRMEFVSNASVNGRLLPGQCQALRNLKALIKKIEKPPTGGRSKEQMIADCRLTMTADGHFKPIHFPTIVEAAGKIETVTWDLKRTMRLGSPYVDQLMDKRIELLGRRALDLDYMA